MLKNGIWIGLLSLLLLSACNSPVYNQTEANVANERLKVVAAREKSDNDAKQQPALLVKDGMYVDATPISLAKQPSWLKNNVVIRGDALPFSYYSRTVASGANSNVLTKYQTGLDQAASMSINYNGTVKGALDLLASKTGYTYTVKNNSVYWQAFVTRTFDVAFMPGGTDYMMGKASGGSASSSSSSGTGTVNFTESGSSDEYSNLTGKLSVWDDLKATIGQLLSSDGNVTVSQATTSVTVRDRPMNVEVIAQYIANLNSKLAKQVLVKVQVLEVDLSSDFSYGLDWGAIARAFHNSPFVMNASYGTPINISNVFTQQVAPSVPEGLATPLAAPAYPQMGFQGNGQTPSYTILVNALSQQGKTSVVSEPRVVCLNNQVSVVRIVQQEGYVASIQNTTVAGASSGSSSASNNTVTSQVTPGNIVTGLTLYILPKIMDNKILMQVNADLSTKKALVTFGSGSSEVQLPTVAEKHFNQRSMIKSGDTLILSGFRQVSNSAQAMQLFRAQSLGGKGAEQVNQETVVLITPIILSGSA